MLYLPITQETINLLCIEGLSDHDYGSRLTNPELCSVLTISTLSESSLLKIGSVEKRLADFMDVAKEVEAAHDPGAFFYLVSSKFEADRFKAGAALMTKAGIGAMSDEDMEERRFLDVSGGWNYRYNQGRSEQSLEERHQRQTPKGQLEVLTHDQSRAYSVIKGDLQEPIHIQGYAGTGKTHMINAIAELYASKGHETRSILLLGHTQPQLNAIQKRLDHRITTSTFWGMATSMIRDGQFGTGDECPRGSGKGLSGYVPFDQYESEYGVNAVGFLDAPAAARAAMVTLHQYCLSDRDEIERRHIPSFAQKLHAIDQERLIQYAKMLWEIILYPQPNTRVLPRRAYHTIKFVALRKDWIIPVQYSHLIIDESHTASKAMLQIVDRCPQSSITLGDEYQNLDGMYNKRSSLVQQTTVAQSMRAGKPMEGVVNPIIRIHPNQTKQPFTGNSEDYTEVEYYSKPFIPEQPCAIYVADEWGLLEWAQRLTKQQVSFQLLDSSEELTRFITDVIDLYYHGTRARHGALFKYSNWDDAYEDMNTNSAFRVIHKILEKKYKLKNWHETKNKYIKTDADYVLSTIRSGRNYEFDRVMMTPPTIESLWDIETRNNYDDLLSLYVGSTRVKHYLYLPEGHRNWAEEMVGKRRFIGV